MMDHPRRLVHDYDMSAILKTSEIYKTLNIEDPNNFKLDFSKMINFKIINEEKKREI